MKYITITLFVFTLLACKKKNQLPTDQIGKTDPIDFSNKYRIVQNKIYNYANPTQFIGANALHSFGAGSADMANWNMDIVREFVGNVKEQPISGVPIQDANGAFLHSLQAVIDSNRKTNKVTIICPFRWNGQPNTDFTGTRPTLTYWYAEFKTKLQQWATYFKNQPDVWLELWNEPYIYDRTDGYTDDIWLSDMNDLTAIIRNTGNKNIILVPCAEQGQDERVLINKASTFLADKTNILFDIHAYEKWLLVPSAAMGDRLQQLKIKNIPIFFGEVGPMNAGVLMDTRPFLDSIYSRGISTTAWLWKYDAADPDALLNIQGLPNNNNNYNWGGAYKNLCNRVRNP